MTRVLSEHTVEVNGVPRHVKDLRRRRAVEDGCQQPSTGEEDERQVTSATEEMGDEDWSDWDDEM